MPSALSINPREVYEKNPAYTGQEEQFRLRPYEWEFYLRLDGCRVIQEICDARSLTLESITPTVDRLVETGLIRAVEISMDEFYRRFIQQPVASAPVVPTPAAPVGTNHANSADADGERCSFSLHHTDSAGAQPPALVPTPVVSEELYLKPLLDFVASQAGGGTLGQLAVYRVFLKVPNDLLREAGIRSLNLVAEDFTIRDPQLKRCLHGAVEEVLGRPYAPVSAEVATVMVA